MYEHSAFDSVEWLLCPIGTSYTALMSAQILQVTFEVGQGVYPMAQCPQESGGDVRRNWSRTLCHSRATELQTKATLSRWTLLQVMLHTAPLGH